VTVKSRLGGTPSLTCVMWWTYEPSDRSVDNRLINPGNEIGVVFWGVGYVHTYTWTHGRKCTSRQAQRTDETLGSRSLPPCQCADSNEDWPEDSLAFYSRPLAQPTRSRRVDCEVRHLLDYLFLYHARHVYLYKIFRSVRLVKTPVARE
jgi:hypothetical protein